MKLRIPPPASTYRVVLILAIVCLLAACTGVILVGAHNDDNNLPPADQSTTSQQNAADKTRIAEQFGRLPLSFEINKGQIDESVKFLSRGSGYDLFLTATEAVLKVQKPPAQQTDKLKGTDPSKTAADANVREGTVLRLKMLGANGTPEAEGQEELPGRIHYFNGNDPAKWRRNIPTYRKAYFKDVYPGIDVVYYGNQQELEYDFVVAAGANPKLIRFTVAGADQIRLDKAGRLLLNLKHGDVTLNKPVIYQLNENGGRDEVKGAYVIKGNEVRFKLERFDSSKPLIIDPVLSYSTLLGSSNNDQAFGISVDSQGNAYVTGTTDGTTFPTTAGSFKSTSTGSGAFVTKLNPAGTALVYSTYISGQGSTNATSIAVDSSGNAHITGVTSARDFPIVNGLKTTSSFFKTTAAAVNWNNQNTGLVGDANLIAVAPNAPNTIYAATTDGIYRSTDAGGTWIKAPATGLSSPTFATALAVDPSNSLIVYVSIFSGLAKSTDGGNNWTNVNTSPLSFSSVSTIVFDPATPSTMYVGASNGVFKSSDSGATWIAQNNFSVAGTPNVRALAIDPTSPLTIYAGTSNNGLFKSTNGGGVWTAMNSGMGGPNPTNVNVIAIDPSNTATLYTGHGFSGGINKSTNGAASWTPLTNEVPQNNSINAMVATSSAVYAAISNGGIIKSTNGGTNWTSANSGLWSASVRTLVVRPNDSSTLYAGTGSGFFTDAFVTKLNAAGSGLLFSTLLGGSSDETGNGIAVDGNGNIYVAGQTTSLNFPVANAVQSAPASINCSDGFVTKINPSAPSYAFSTYLRGGGCDTANSVAVDSSANVYVTGTTGSNDFLIANAFQSTFAGTCCNSDAFVTKLTTAGALIYSTYLGGSSAETGFAITADSSGHAYVTGFTTSTNFPTMNAIQPIMGGGPFGFNPDAFVTKLSDGGSALVYSTYLGGSNSDTARGIAIDSANNVYVAGFSDSGDFPVVAGALRTKSPMYKSTDGAANWSNDNYGFGGSFATNVGSLTVTALAVDPTQPSTVYAGSTNGVFKSTNGGRTWSEMNNGLTNRNVTALVINPSAPSTLYITVSNFFGGGTGVYKSTNGGNSWNPRNNGIIHTELLSLAIDPVTPNTLYLGVNFCCVTGSHIYKTTDGGDSWAPIAGAPPVSPASIVLDPLNHSTLYVADQASTTAVYKSPDAGTTWQTLVLTGSTNSVRSVAASPVTAGLLYAGTDQALFKSVDGGSNWSKIPNQSGKIVFDPVNASTAYLVPTNPFASNPQGLLKSTDNGQTWRQVNKGLNSPQPLVLAINPNNPSTLYLALTATGGTDAFVTKINAGGNALLYSTFLGGPIPIQCCSSTNSQAFGIAVDSSSNAYVTGMTGSVGFPVTPDSYQPFNRGSVDAFISKLGTSYTISGRVLQNGSPGSPLGGAEIVLSDGTSLTSVFSESDGTYQFSRLREGGNYTISASAPHFSMSPASQAFNNLNSDQVLDFSANTSDSDFFFINGQVTENGVPLSGVTVTLSGSQSGLRTTDSNGNYSFQVIIAGNYTVTPSIVGFTFAPANQTFNSLNTNQTANFAATRQSFVVTNDNNHGTGSFRDAITNANATPGTDTITFNIPGSGVKTINLVISLPEITDRVVIDATTQPGYAGTPLIELNGSAIGGFNGGNGLVIRAGGSTVRGLAIGNFGSVFGGGGSGIWLNACDNNVIQANYIGIAADGTTTRANARGIQLTNSSNNLIGGPTSAARNVISGNSTGIEVSGNGNAIQGNFIGTNATGTAAVRNNVGISIFTSFTNNVIGGTAAADGNLISGNSTAISTNGNATTIQGNRIGTDVTGTIKLPNSTGIQAFGLNIQIGGVTPGARNIISGNQGDAVNVRGVGSKVQGNYIGTDITGTLPLGNSGTGVSANDGVWVGGTQPGARNIVSANSNFGNVVVGNNSFGVTAPNTVQGNYIGTDVTGTRALGSPSTAGINILSNNNTVGGVLEAARNVVSGNDIGIQLGGSFSGTTGNLIQGNYIGLNAAGTGPLPNNRQGIAVNDAVGNTIGGTQSGAGNKIAFNGGPGLTMSNGSGNSIRGNSIFSNNGLGIDLGINGVTPNDGVDGDSGPNQLQNFPVISGVTSSSNSTTIQGSLKSIPSTTFDVDFYSNAAVDPSGNGEGAQFLGTTSVSTNGSGDGNINVTFQIGLAAGRAITATATDPNGNTSEFSAADAASAAGSLQFSASSIAAIEDVGTLPITVLRTGGTAGSLTVDFATANGTAIAGQDYTSTSGTLTFGAGETSKTIQVPITDDSTTEADETFTISLSNTPSLESLGSPNTLQVTIQDRTTVPSLVINSLLVQEGNTGSTDILFTVNLSAATGRTVRVDFATVNQGAFGGSKCDNSAGIDYVSASGTFTFSTGTTAFAVPVKICGDTNAEVNESLRLALSNVTGASFLTNQGFATIIDDDLLSMLLEESSPDPNQAAAIESVLGLRDPFNLFMPDWFTPGINENTRVTLFAQGLQLNPGELPSAVRVILQTNNGLFFNIPAEDVRQTPNSEFTQVIFRLPNTLPPGACSVSIFAHSRQSNFGTIRIAP